jgi:hypothetical protein
MDIVNWCEMVLSATGKRVMLGRVVRADGRYL